MNYLWKPDTFLLSENAVAAILRISKTMLWEKWKKEKADHIHWVILNGSKEGLSVFPIIDPTLWFPSLTTCKYLAYGEHYV